MSGLLNNSLFLSTAAAAGGYQIERSLRFNSSDSAFCSRTPAVAGNRRTFTFSTWVKRSKLSSGFQQLICSYDGSTGSTYFSIIFTPSDTIRVEDISVIYRETTQVFRDASAWYCIQLAVDTTQATAANRIKLYVNGSEVTTFATTNNPTQNTDFGINNTVAHAIGRSGAQSAYYLDGYLAECYLIDGQQLTSSSFTEVSATTGQLIPLAYSGTFGTNGFWLKFSDNSAATAAALGNDYSGNNNDWTPNNLSVTAGAGNDSLVDTPTSFGTDTGVGGEVRGNYATWNPLSNGVGTLSNGNLQLGGMGGDGLGRCNSTFAMSSGKWYFETTLTTASSDTVIGIGQGNTTTQYPGQDGVSYAFVCEPGIRINSNSQVSYGVSLTTGDVLMVAFDLDNSKIFFGKNGTWMASSNPVTGANPAFTLTTGEYKPIARPYSSSAVINSNFGQRAFAYTAPSGFKALCDTNLPAPLTAKPNTLMDVVKYDGNGSTQTISGLGFSPDFVWIKQRSGSSYHVMNDAVRGAGKILSSNDFIAEDTNTTAFQAFTSDGFTVAVQSPNNWSVNGNSATYVAWTWDAGTSTVSNTAGSIASQVRANATAGFSVVTFNSGASNGDFTVGHGLGVAPRMIIMKSRTRNGGPWWVYHASTTTDTTKYLELSTTGATITNSGGNIWGSALPTSTLFGFSVGAGKAHTQNEDIVSYCFTPVVGYSSVSSYVGNGSSDGPFVYTGFRPRWIMVKRSDAGANDWYVLDTSRSTYNVAINELLPNSSAAENPYTGVDFDLLSNGFKVRATEGSINASGGTFIFAAFAENPFQYARAR